MRSRACARACAQYPTTWLHELGHNLYMNHAGSYQDVGGSMQVRGVRAVCVCGGGGGAQRAVHV
jgi:hypothetical protein